MLPALSKNIVSVDTLEGRNAVDFALLLGTKVNYKIESAIKYAGKIMAGGPGVID